MKIPIFLLSTLCALWLNPAKADNPLGSHLDGLLDYASQHNPELAATRYEAEAARQRAESAGALPDPVLRTELMDITRQGTTSPQLLPSQTGSTRYTFLQSVPWFGKRGLQHGVADAQASQARGQVAATWSDLATRIKQTYAMHYFAIASEQLSQQTLALLDNLEKIAQTRYANGLGQQQDVIRVQIEKTILRSELISLQADGHHTHVQMNSLLSRPVSAPLANPEQLRGMPPAAKLDEVALLERLRTQNPQLRIADASVQSSERARDLAYVNRYPNFTLGVAPNQYGDAVRSWDLMLEVNIPLQQSSRRSQEREAESLLSASSSRKETLLDKVRSELSENLSALDSTSQTERLVATRLLPQAELTYQSALVGYQNGKVDFAILIEAHRQILKAKQQQLKAQTDMQLRLADIEKLLGGSL